MKTCGIIGGMGPDATALFYMKLIRNFQNRESYPPVLLYSVPEPFQATDAWIKENQGGDYLQKLILEGVRLLDSRVGFIVIPCNTAHMFMPHIRQVASVPVISMIEETCAYIQLRKRWNKVGVLASTATIQSGLYTYELHQRDIEPVMPDQSQQELLAAIIMHIVKGQFFSKDRTALQRMVVSLLARGAEGVLLACTDLPVLLTNSYANPVLLDAMDVLAEVASAWVLEESAGLPIAGYIPVPEHRNHLFQRL